MAGIGVHEDLNNGIGYSESPGMRDKRVGIVNFDYLAKLTRLSPLPRKVCGKR